MTRTERAMLRDALYEAVMNYTDNPTEAAHYYMFGLRVAAGLLGMPEGHSNYDWTTGPTPDRQVRRRLVLRRRARASHRN